MKIEKAKSKLLQHKRGIALGMAILLSGLTFIPYI